MNITIPNSEQELTLPISFSNTDWVISWSCAARINVKINKTGNNKFKIQGQDNNYLGTIITIGY